MQCEMCGQKVPFLKKVKIEGTQMEVCSNCARFGDEVTKKAAAQPSRPAVVSQRLERRAARPLYKDVFDTQDTEESLITDYAEKIMRARNSKRLTKKELAAKINEKLSVIHSLERGELHPDDQLIRKLENELEISLREKISDVKVEKRAYSQGMTLGDFIKKK
ncbi:MAG: multiprotein bridging factor aMBF1 [Thermoplasmata archaeon]|nr:multiprotein bridging factor aMBF1 [Thermoplasmata archaeon]